jgi:hypothetical protein
MATYVMLFMPIGPVAFPSEIDKAKYTPEKEKIRICQSRALSHQIKWGEHAQTFRKILESRQTWFFFWIVQKNNQVWRRLKQSQMSTAILQLHLNTIHKCAYESMTSFHDARSRCSGYACLCFLPSPRAGLRANSIFPCLMYQPSVDP